jgi:D-alanyl-D-alanine carboxypeptidase (penicillin-binding protein 5/6)
MKRKRILAIASFGVTFLWLHFTGQGWSESRPVLNLHSEAAVLMDGTTGQILFEKNPEKRFGPASLVKMMTLYLAFDAIKQGIVTFDNEEAVSKKTWKMGGSQMFLKVGDKVKLIELIRGVASISANDGAVAIAEFLTGAEEVFVHQMNQKAKELGLKNTRFVNCHGLHADGQYTSAMDMANLGFHYIHEHPDALKFHSIPEYAYRGIKQKNWNPLLNHGIGVDGLKTGYLARVGYHFLFTGEKDGQRLVGVVMGARTGGTRKNDALKLIKFGFKNFSTITLVKEGEVVGKVKVQKGDPPEVELLANKTLVVTVWKGREQSAPLRKEIPESVDPPIKRGAVLGRLVLEGEGFPKREISLVAKQDVQPKSYATYYAIGSAAAVGLLAFLYWTRRTPRKKRKKRRK